MYGDEPYVYRFSRHNDIDIFNAIREEERSAAAQQRRQAAEQASEETGTFFAARHDIERGTPLDEASDSAHNYLTEVYGYTAEDADQFLFALQQLEDGLYCVYYHPTAPEWRYLFRTDDPHGTAVTPYSQPHHPAPEGPFRSFWYEVESSLSLNAWTDGDRGAFLTLAQDPLYAIALSDDAQQAIRLGEMSAADAVAAVFEAHYGSRSLWTPALQHWHASTLSRFQLQ